MPLTLSMRGPLALAEIGFDDPGISTHLVGLAFGDLFSVVQNMNAVRDSHDDAHVMLDEKNRLHMSADEILEQCHGRARLAAVHPRRGLVEQQYLRRRRQRPGD